MDIAAHVKSLVDQAPPPSPEQLARLRLILCGASNPEDGERLIQKAMNDLEKSPVVTGRIYVIKFSSGTLKVGRSVGQQRLAQHRMEAQRHGIEIVNEWLSEPHASWFENEKRLIEWCVQAGGENRHVRSEYFTGLEFEPVKLFAESLVAE